MRQKKRSFTGAAPCAHKKRGGPESGVPADHLFSPVSERLICMDLLGKPTKEPGYIFSAHTAICADTIKSKLLCIVRKSQGSFTGDELL